MNVSVLIVFFSFFVLGTILTFTITNYWSSEKLNLLDVRAKNVASYMKGYLAVNEPLDLLLINMRISSVSSAFLRARSTEILRSLLQRALLRWR